MALDWPLPAYECDAAGRLRQVSPALAALCGRPAASLTGASLLELAEPADRAALEAALRGPGPRALSWRLLAGGARVPVQDEAARAQDQAWRGVLLDRRAALLAEAEAEERVALLAQGQLAASLAHEVNNPLSGVLNYAQLATRLCGEARDLREALAAIEGEAQRILELTRGLVVYALRSHEPYPPDVAALLRATLAPVRRALREELVQLELSVEPDLPPVRARGLALQAVCRELVGNAREALAERWPVQAVREQGKRLALRARGGALDADELPSEVLLEVEDGGSGLPPGAGQAFFSTRPGRRGLGLSRAREHLARLGGALELDRAPGGGALIRLRVPVWP